MYVDYYFYQTAYAGSIITESEFQRFAARASAYIDGHTADLTDVDADVLKYCCCELADAMKSNTGQRISSVSNDGYTESYELADPDTTYQAIIADYLPSYSSDEVVRFI